ncbi:hypothetical protein [Xylanimonas ulmi]|uniref:Uncharacterized protein n=1 Tax=Xylanimonas ulmi TaxID=228973 RepID=A0A4Q7M8W4_9MICO|nr:hypothetical protein [Xylanibacterium ulmi]RZS63112.1 hypothetical protein EV386_3470 [Xylanibacterium ulmi]
MRLKLAPWDPNPAKPLWLSDPHSADGARPSALAVALRPFGYLLYAAFFWLILLIVIGLAVGFVVFAAVATRPDGPLSDVAWDGAVSGAVEGFGRVGAVLVWLVVAVLASMCFGAAMLVYLPLSTAAAALVASLAFARSLQHRYREEKITGTSWARPGDTLGFRWPGPDGRGLAITIPVRRTPYSIAVVKLVHAGYFVKRWTFLAGWAIGVSYVATLVIVWHDVPPTVTVVAAVVGVVGLGLSVPAFVRARREYVDPRSR